MHKSHIFPTAAPNFTILLLFMCLTIVVAVAGCGNHSRKLTSVNGKVTYRGKPLQFGSVMFVAETGQPATATIQPMGLLKW